MRAFPDKVTLKRCRRPPIRIVALGLCRQGDTGLSELLGPMDDTRQTDMAGFVALVAVYGCVLGTSRYDNDLSAGLFGVMTLLCVLLGCLVQYSDAVIRRFRDQRLGLAAVYFAEIALCLKISQIEFSGRDPGLIWLLAMPPLVALCLFRLRWWVTLLGILGLLSTVLLANFDVRGWASTQRFAFELMPLYIFVSVFATVMARESQMRREKEALAEQLAAANQRLRAYAAEAEAWATMRERNRLARDIHDSLGHYLTAVNMLAAAASAVLREKPEQSIAMLAQIQNTVKQGLHEVRGSVASLREDPIAGKTPAEFLSELAEVTRRQGAEVTLSFEGSVRPLEPVLNQVIYRGAQESLTNVRKYAEADHVWLTLLFGPDTVTFQCRDDGRGCDTLTGGFGLTGLRERAKMVGGTVSFETAPGQGFCVTLTCPYADAAPTEENP